MNQKSEPIIDGLNKPFVRISLTQGEVTLVDVADLPLIEAYTWIHSKGYAASTLRGGGAVYLHRLLLSPPEQLFVDHINRNGLDNRRNNLRICNKTQNAFNSKIRIDNVSGARGVSYDKARDKWRAQIKEGSKYRCIGRFLTFEEAFQAYQQEAKRIAGVFIS